MVIIGALVLGDCVTFVVLCCVSTLLVTPLAFTVLDNDVTLLEDADELSSDDGVSPDWLLVVLVTVPSLSVFWDSPCDDVMLSGCDDVRAVAVLASVSNPACGSSGPVT